MQMSECLDQFSDMTTHRKPVSKIQKVAWHKVTDDHVQRYKECLDSNVDNIDVPYDVLLCKDVFCKNDGHRQMIDELCKSLIQCCIDSSNICLPHSQAREHTLPFWNELIEPLKKDSLFWHWLWIECGRPKEGAMANVMRSTRAKYHKAVKDLQKNEEQLRRDRMAEAISMNCMRNLWNETKKNDA